MELLLIGAGLYLWSRRNAGAAGGSPATDAQKQQTPTQPQGGPLDLGTAAGAVGSLVGLGTTLAGAFGGGGAALGTGTAIAGGSGAAVAEGGAAGGGGGIAATEAAGGTIAASTVGAAFFWTGVMLVVNFCIWFIGWLCWTAADRASRWSRWVTENALVRYPTMMFMSEQDMIEAVVDPAQKNWDPTTGQPPPQATALFTSRQFITYLKTGGRVDTDVPIGLKMEPKDELFLRRFARWSAATRLSAYNQAQYWFWTSPGMPPTNRCFHDDQFVVWLRDYCLAEPCAEELGGKAFADWGTIEDVVTRTVGPLNKDLARANWRFVGAAQALQEAAVQGFSFGWPGDKEFCTQLLQRCHLDTQGWSIQQFVVAGSERWIAVDQATRAGVDVIASRERGVLVAFAPEALGQATAKFVELPNALPVLSAETTTTKTTFTEFKPISGLTIWR